MFRNSAAQKPPQMQIIDFQMNGYLVLFLALKRFFFGLAENPIGLVVHQACTIIGEKLCNTLM